MVKKLLFQHSSILLMGLFLALTSSCVKEEFLKVCYDDIQSGCVSLNNADSNTPLKSVSFTTSTASHPENIGGVSFTVVLSEAHQVDIAVPFTISGSLDFQNNNDVQISGLNVVFNSTTGQGILTIPAGFSSQSIIYDIVDDNKAEVNETSYITLGNPTNAILGTISTMALTVVDNDADSVANFSQISSTVVEGASVQTITINLDKPTGKNIQVFFARSGTASYGTDHALNLLSVTIPAEASSYAINFSLLADNIQEADETIILTITSATGAILGTNLVHTMTITDNDNPPYLFFPNVFEVVQEADGSKSVTVSISAASELDIFADYTVTGSSTIGDDHDLAVTGTVTILAGQTSGTITFNIIDDSLAEVDETMVLTLSNPVNGILSPSVTYTMMIQDNETPPVVNFKKYFSSWYEYTYARQVKIYIQLDKQSQSDVTVPFSVSILSTAVPGFHYNIASMSVIIPAGSVTRPITIDVDPLSDPYNGDNKTIILNLDTPTGATVGDVASHTVTILDPMFIHLPNDLDLLVESPGTFTELPANRLNKVNVDADDTLSVSTKSGYAYSFDKGLSFRNYGASSGVLDNNIKSSFFDATYANSYLATAAGLAISTNNEGYNFLKTTDGLASNDVVAVVADQNRIIAASPTALSISTSGGTGWSTISSISGLAYTQITDLKIDPTTKVVTVLTNGGLAQTADWGLNFINTLTTSNYLPSNNILDFQTSGTNVYILTDLGLIFGDINTPASFTYRDNTAIGISSTKIKNIAIDSSGIMYVCGKDSIAISTDATGSAFNLLTSVSGIVFNNNINIDVDSTDTFFIATETKGIYKSSDSFATMDNDIYSNSSLSDLNISAIDHNSSDELFIATEYGLNRCSTLDCSNITRNTSIYNGKINHVSVRQPDDKLFVTTDAGYAYSTDFTTFTHVASAIAPLSTIFSIYVNGSTLDQLFIGSQNSLSTNGGFFTSFNNGATGPTYTTSTAPVLPGNSITAYFYDSVHLRHLIGNASGGVSTTKDNFGTFSHFYPVAGAVNKILAKDDAATLGHLYIATDSGLFLSNNFYEDSRTNCALGLDSLPDDYCEFNQISFGMVSSKIQALDVIDVGGSHIIFAGTDQGLSVSADMGSNFQTFGNNSGLPSSNIKAIKAVMPAGKVFVGTDKGLGIIKRTYP